MPSIPSIIALLAALATAQVFAHMMMSSPAPRQSVSNPGPGGLIDYSYTAPLTGVNQFSCKGYPAQAPVLTVAAGSSIPVQVTGGANHGGGHCQFAISFSPSEAKSSWVVLDTVVRSCLQAGAQSFNIPIPAGAPSGKATFAWTWINAVGNREYYMNCADIQITGGSGPSGSITGPALLVANLEGYPSIPEFGSPSLPDMHELLDQRPIITVSGNGGVSSSPAAPPAPPAPVAAPQPAPTQPSQGQQDPSPASPPSPAQQPPAQSPPKPQPRANGRQRGACLNGQLKCDGPSQWALCTPARVWVSQPVPPGTKCNDDSGAVVFELA